MQAEEFEDLVSKAGLNLLSKWAPRFIVSLYVPKSYGGVQGNRIQTGAITFASEKAMGTATSEECQCAIDEIVDRLGQAAQTQQGSVAKGGEVKVKVEREVVAPVGINYPAH